MAGALKAEKHRLMDGKLHIYRRENSSHWQCSTYLNGRNWRVSTHEESLSQAKDVALDWFYSLKGKHHSGLLKTGKTFKEASEKFIGEVEAMIAHERNPLYVTGHEGRLRAHLNPFFGKRLLSEITPGIVQEYRVHRATTKKDDNGNLIKPARNTIHKEIVTLRQVLKTAERHGWISHVPDLRDPFNGSGKVSHRGWFSPAEYRQLYEATRKKAENSALRDQWSWEQLHDQVLLIANSGLRPDEAARLEFRDVEIVEDEATGETILEIEVRGKWGVGFCKSMPGAVHPFTRLRDRMRAKDNHGNTVEGLKRADRYAKVKPSPDDLIFPTSLSDLLNDVLIEQKLKVDRDGLPRTTYSLRHSYICFRLLEGADIYQVAKNCRTSVEIIQKHYAAHLKNMLDTALINVRKPEPSKKRRLESDRPSPNSGKKKARVPKKSKLLAGRQFSGDKRPSNR